MNNSFVRSSVLLIFLIAGVCAAGADVKRTVSPFDYWGYGNHRVMVKVDQKAAAVRVHIPWRRRDLNSEARDIRVYSYAHDTKKLSQIKNVVRINVLNEYGDIAFEANSVGEYYVYYLPYTSNISPFVPVVYDDVKITFDPVWAKSNGLDFESIKAGKWKTLPEAKLVEIQARPDYGIDGGGVAVMSEAPEEIKARNDFHRFDPMEVIATKDEVTVLKEKYPGDYLLFVEDRDHPIKMFDYLPLRWIENGPGNRLDGKCQPGEYYPFQIGIFAARKDISKVTLAYSDLKNEKGETIPSSAFTCINLRGRSIAGEWFVKEVNFKKDFVQPLWICLDVPKKASGTYKGQITFNAAGVKSSTIALVLQVEGSVLADHGDSNVRRLSRLRWLDSDLGLDEQVIAPFTPVEVNDTTVKILNRQITLDGLAMPASILSNNESVLTKPVELVVSTVDGVLKWKNSGLKKVFKSPAKADFVGKGENGLFDINSKTQIEFDGCVNLSFAITAKKAVNVSDIGLKLYINPDIAQYMMGFGQRGGFRAKEIGWMWDVDRATNMFWIGNPDAGLQIKLCHEIDNLFEQNFRNVDLPKNWHNDGRGGVVVYEDGGDVVLRVYSGNRALNAGQTLEFKYRLLVTPFKPLDKKHWSRRFGPEGSNIGLAFQGATNNPYINYPFLNPDYLKKFNNGLQAKGQKSLIYYTTGQISGYMAELYPLRSINDEVFASEVLTYYEDKAIINKSGGGFPWLQEHLVSGYTMGWKQPLNGGETDFGLGTIAAPSRLWNYYVEGFDWLLKNCDVDGLYLDGIGCSRIIMQRAKKVIQRDRPEAIIMNHGGNNYDWADQKISTANAYMEHFPYLDILWYGEGFDYGRQPDYWMTEISGIPFGVGSSMLEYNTGGNPWFGMLYGMTGAQNKATPAIWKLWDTFGIQDAEMIGYWSKKCPVKTNHKDIYATVYQKQDKTLIAIGSWAQKTTDITLTYDWKKLGLDSSKAVLRAPQMENFQPEAVFDPNQAIAVDPGHGWLLILEEKKQ